MRTKKIIPSVSTLIKYFTWMLLIIVMLFFINKFSPKNSGAELYIFKNEELAFKVGKIETVKLRKSTYVQASVGYDGKLSPAYNTFQYLVVGETTKAIMILRENKSDDLGKSRFVLEDVRLK